MFIQHFNDVVFITKLIDFVVFFVLIVWAFRKYLMPMLVAHQEAQNKLVEDGQAYRDKSEAAVSASQQAIEQAKSDAVRMVQVGKAQAVKRVEDARKEAREHAQRIIAHANGELERERYRVRRELFEETVEQAHRQAGELAKREIDAQKQQTLVARLIEDLERTHA